MQGETAMTYGPSEVVALEMSAEFGDLMHALAKAQADMDNPDTDSTNYFRKRYSSMAATRDAIVPCLARAGIASTQLPTPFRDGRVGCITILWYGSQYLKSTVECQVIRTRRDSDQNAEPIAVERLTHIDYTAVFSYLRRTALKAICNLADAEDEDEERTGGGREGQDQQRQAWQGRQSTQMRRESQPPVVQMTDGPQQVLIREISDRCNKAIVPLRHAGMQKAILYHSFGVERLGEVHEQPLEKIEAGMPLYRQLTAQVGAWDRTTKPDDWIREQERRRAAEATQGDSVPAGIHPETGEDLRDMPTGWLTKAEQREQQARDEAALLEQTTA